MQTELHTFIAYLQTVVKQINIFYNNYPIFSDKY